MESIKDLNKWANGHTYYWLDILRVGLGVFLFVKGISFITNSQYLIDMLGPLTNLPGGMLTFHYIATAHIMGGIMIVFGLLTRLAIIAQLPVLFGAMIINFLGEMHFNNLVLATLTLAACFLSFLWRRKHSADYYFKMEK